MKLTLNSYSSAPNRLPPFCQCGPVIACLRTYPPRTHPARIPPRTPAYPLIGPLTHLPTTHTHTWSPAHRPVLQAGAPRCCTTAYPHPTCLPAHFSVGALLSILVCVPTSRHRHAPWSVCLLSQVSTSCYVHLHPHVLATAYPSPLFCLIQCPACLPVAFVSTDCTCMRN